MNDSFILDVDWPSVRGSLLHKRFRISTRSLIFSTEKGKNILYQVYRFWYIFRDENKIVPPQNFTFLRFVKKNQVISLWPWFWNIQITEPRKGSTYWLFNFVDWKRDFYISKFSTNKSYQAQKYLSNNSFSSTHKRLYLLGFFEGFFLGVPVKMKPF